MALGSCAALSGRVENDIPRLPPHTKMPHPKQTQMCPLRNEERGVVSKKKKKMHRIPPSLRRGGEPMRVSHRQVTHPAYRN